MLTIPIILETSPSHLCFDCATAPLSIPLSCLSHLSMSQISVIFLQTDAPTPTFVYLCYFLPVFQTPNHYLHLKPFLFFCPLCIYTIKSCCSFLQGDSHIYHFLSISSQTFITSHMNNCRVFLADLPVAIPKFSLKV